MNRGRKILLWIVMAAALGLIVRSSTGMIRDRSRLREMTAQLNASRSAWEDTAERKEKLQAELKDAQEQLKEAKLSLEESTARAEELREEIAALKSEIYEESSEGNSEMLQKK